MHTVMHASAAGDNANSTTDMLRCMAAMCIAQAWLQRVSLVVVGLSMQASQQQAGLRCQMKPDVAKTLTSCMRHDVTQHVCRRIDLQQVHSADLSHSNIHAHGWAASAQC